ncbi:MAG: hypothetical protein V1695_02170 [Candidatus Uhrbacteria bacterium]
MALFKMSLDELREAFVQHKFASDDKDYGAFSDRNIEEWLSIQQQCDTPDIQATLDRFGQTILNKIECVTVCPQLLDQWADSPTDFEKQVWETGISITSVIFTLQSVRVIQRTYPTLDIGGKPHETGLLIVCRFDEEKFPGHPPAIFHCHRNTIGVARPEHFLEALFWSWTNGGSHKEMARSYILDICQSKIRSARIQAEADFNKAVAVSADGTKIVLADEVWVLERFTERRESETEWFTRLVAKLPAELFRTQKIVRPCYSVFRMNSSHHFREKAVGGYSSELFIRRAQHFLTTIGNTRVYGVQKQYIPPELLKGDE